MKSREDCCGSCISYLTDVDAEGNLTGYHHDREQKDGFCALRDLFYNVKRDEKPCREYNYDEED